MTGQICHRCKMQVGPEEQFCTQCGAPQTVAATSASMGSLTNVLPVGRSALSIIASYAGLFSFMLLPAPFAVILGIIALWDLKRRPHLLGRGRSIFAICAGIAGILFGIWLVTSF